MQQGSGELSNLYQIHDGCVLNYMIVYFSSSKTGQVSFQTDCASGSRNSYVWLD